MSNIIIEIPLIIHLLEALQPEVNDDGPTSKRVKLSEYVLPFDLQIRSQYLLHSVSEAEFSHFSRLSLLVEVLGSKPLPGSMDLLSRLLETLSKVIQSAVPGQGDVAYVEQLLMSAIENAASKVTVCVPRNGWKVTLMKRHSRQPLI